MKTSLVITFTGSDKPGLVDALSRVVAEHHGNWERSRMARLAGRFAGILELTLEESLAAPLLSAMERLEGLTITVDRNAPSAPLAGDRWLRLEVVGQDREGIVREIAGAIALRGVNVEDMSSEIESAPMSGERLFKAKAVLRCPSGLDLADLRRTLERISNELLVDIEIDEAHLENVR